MNYVYGSAALGGVLLGFLAGLLTFKRSLVWCRDCGSVLACPRQCSANQSTTRAPGIGLGTNPSRRLRSDDRKPGDGDG